ncbi:MAG: extracellular solute-binding protein [Chloroflexi bacterium]|nr:extracellular solute-binding protein [Chloroflexota bacterium]
MLGTRASFIARRALCVMLIAAGASVVSCAAAAPSTPAPSAPTPPIASVATTPTESAASASRVTPTREARPGTPSGAFTLTVWMAEEIAPGTTPAGRILRNQLDAFSAANSGIRIEIVPKKSSGKGGLLDFLTSTRAVVPARLPDLIALDLSDVPLAADAGFTQPLDGLLAAESSADLVPFAAQAARYQNQWVALPFAANVEHLVYNKATVRQVPKTWDDFTKQKATLLLPLGGDSAFLLQYLALGATLTDAANKTAIDSNAAAQTFAFFKRARDLGLLPDSALNLKTADDAWPAFAAGQVAMAQISAARFMTERAKAPNAVYASMPTREGKSAALATGWAFVVITSDATRQQAAARFMQWITVGERLAPWLRATHLLPASRASIVLAVEPADYANFLRDQLEHATSLPPTSSYTRQADAWRSAIAAVWKGQLTPEEAARNAAK